VYRKKRYFRFIIAVSHDQIECHVSNHFYREMILIYDGKGCDNGAPEPEVKKHALFITDRNIEKAEDEEEPTKFR
jgi:hypothetical protein